MADLEDQVNQAWERVTLARIEFFAYQEALLEIASPSKVEGIDLDAKQRLASKLVDRLGLSTISDTKALEIFDTTAAVLGKLGLVRETQPEAKPSDITVFLENETLRLQKLLGDDESGEDLFARCVGEYMHLVKRVQPRSAIIIESSLISAVSNFESFISRLISASLKLNPTPLNSSERKFEYKEVVSFASIDEFTSDAVDKFTDNMMRDSLDKWINFFATVLRQTNIKWISDDLNEVLQRRHIHVHNGGNVSQAYLDNIVKSSVNPNLHDHLPVSIEYLGEALDKMAGVVLFLSQAAMSSIRDLSMAKSISFEKSDMSTNQIAFDLLVDGRNGAISKIYNQMDPLFWTAITREYFRANCWQARKNLHGLDSVKSEVSVWDVTLSPMIELAKFTILENIPKAQILLKRLLAEKQMELIQVATWPVLEPLRRAVIEVQEPKDAYETEQSFDLKETERNGNSIAL